jgi:hypothetical protein
MAPPPSLRQISREALGDVPAYVDRLLEPLNRILGEIQDALSGNITVENLAAARVDVTVSEGTTPPAIPLPKLRGRAPWGVTVERVQVLGGGAAPTSAVGVLWAPTSIQQGQVAQPGLQITAVYGLAAGARATLTLLVKGE